jgi:ribosomal protein S27AE
MGDWYREKGESISYEGPTCPYCGSEYESAENVWLDNVFTCGYCGATFRSVMRLEPTWETSIIKKGKAMTKKPN